MVKSILGALVLVVLFFGAVALADSEKLTPAQERDASEAISSVMSPFCPGRLLSDCPSSDAAALRDQIKAKIASGQSMEDITTFMINLYGNRILAAPRFEGVGRLAWLAPIAFVIAGLLLVLAWLRLNSSDEDPDIT